MALHALSGLQIHIEMFGYAAHLATKCLVPMIFESLILAIALSGSVTHPADYESPFTDSCRPQQEASFREAYFQILPLKNPTGQRIVLSALDPLMKLGAAYTCICFEAAFSDIEAPVSYVDLWESVQLLAEGHTEEARRLLRPLHDASPNVRENYKQQAASRGLQFQSCTTTLMGGMGDIPIYSPIVIIIRGKLGLIRY